MEQIESLKIHGCVGYKGCDKLKTATFEVFMLPGLDMVSFRYEGMDMLIPIHQIKRIIDMAEYQD